MTKLILASKSHGRQRMLEQAGIDFLSIPADVDEQSIKNDFLKTSDNLAGLALKLSQAKSLAVNNNHPDSLVIGSDQILTCENKLFSKVKSLEDAAKQIGALQGRSHLLISGVSCHIDNKEVFNAVETVQMTMRPMTPNAIDNYLEQSGEKILGSVGCYQIEAEGIQLFEKIKGSYFAIMGIPLIPLLNFLYSKDGISNV